MKVYIHLGYGFDAASYAQRYREGRTNDLTPYGFHLAEGPTTILSFSRDENSSRRGRLAQWLTRRLRFDLLHAWVNRHAIRDSDIIWTMTDGEAFAVAALMSLGIVPKRPIIGNAVWLFDRWSHFPSPVKVMFKQLSRKISVLTVHSQACLPVAHSVFPGLRVELTHFGINLDSYEIRKPEPTPAAGPIRVLAAGNDKTRDWSTLLAALGNDERFALSAWTPSLNENDVKRNSNLSLPKPDTLDAIIELYLTHDVVIVPMIPNIFSGITVALEAAALGKPIICSDTGGVPTYFDATQVQYVPPEDANALRDAVLRIRDGEASSMAGAAQARLIRSGYNTQTMIRRYIELSQQLLYRS